MGIGQKTTPRAFVNACEVFVFTQNLITEIQIPKTTLPSREEAPASNVDALTDPLPLLKNAFDMAAQEDGWAFLGTVGGHLHRLDPSFDSRTYGHKQLLQLIRAYKNTFEIRVEKSRSGPSLIYIKLKDENGQ